VVHFTCNELVSVEENFKFGQPLCRHVQIGGALLETAMRLRLKPTKSASKEILKCCRPQVCDSNRQAENSIPLMASLVPQKRWSVVWLRSMESKCPLKRR
jgi:hypothetical protein